MRLGKVVKSNSHCDYVVQVDDARAVISPPQAEDYGFGSFVKIEGPDKRHWAVGVIYNSQLVNPLYNSNGPRLTSEPDPLFTPDLVNEIRTLLSVVLIGSLEETSGVQGIPRVVVPVDMPVCTMTQSEVKRFHSGQSGKPQFCYYGHLLRSGGPFAPQLVHQILEEISGLFEGPEGRALEILRREMSWKITMGAMR
ncbi:hypothetical protein [Leptolyngbya sp. FACHB-261]|uniref:hypothetical protein n=1 Tax=Leptolyngbya sp. FACHB-261 TaxID=2692806 RepID=UPI001684BFE5|nr:hypothetical protein [Leptolyngbya sp. FACHB-261]MBD2102877.1 hypothetical protein [Leptolyngbya sp. FACHB-261]